MGFFIESYSGRTYQGLEVPNTGGTSIFGTASVSLFLNAIAIRGEVQLPVIEKLNGVQMWSKPVPMVDISYNF